jgi:DivIVA domain-containing protein
MRPGYDPEQVDALIRRIEGTLGRGALEGAPITADEIRRAQFKVKRGGYHEMAVDFALEAFSIAIEAGGGQSPAPAPDQCVLDLSGVPPIPPSSRLPWPSAPAGGQGGDGDDEGAVPGAAHGRAAANGAARAAALGLHGLGQAGDDEEPVWQGGAERGHAVPAAGTVRADTGPADDEDTVFTPVVGTPEWFEAQAVLVERASFHAGRLGLGYDEDEVDAFLERVAATLRGTAERPLTADEVRRARFSTVMFRPGYLAAEVDEFLVKTADMVELHDLSG